MSASGGGGNFNLYALTLQPPSSISQAISGSFSDAGAHEFCVLRGQSHLEILERDTSTNGSMIVAHREPVFGKVRNLAALRLNGQKHDLIALTSDSGKLSILRYHSSASSSSSPTRLEKLYCESFGKTGCRRSVPGEYIAADPQGRCVMLAAVEKDKLVFGTNRDAQDELFVASPLEAHRANTVTVALCALDVGFDNPVFAALETAYDATAAAGGEVTRQLVLYEVDLGLNHVVRKSQRRVSATANHLVPLPDSQGVFVCSEDGLELFSIKPASAASQAQAQGQVLVLPRRAGDAELAPPALVTCSTHFRNKGTFFALVQTERGDLFKLDGGGNAPYKLAYLDTVAPSNQICLAKNGTLLCASEFADHHVYEIASMPEEQDEAATTFTPRTELANLDQVAQLPSCAPIVQFKASDLAKDAGVQQIYALCGRAHQSTFRVLRQGLPVLERGVIRFPLAKNDACRGVWTVRDNASSSSSSSYVLLALQDSTKVLRAKTERGEEDVQQRDVIEEADGSSLPAGIVTDHTTIAAGNWGSGSGSSSQMLQITSAGWRRVDLATGKVLDQFQLAPGAQKKIDVACLTATQFCFAMTGGAVFYFEAEGGGGSGGKPREVGRVDLGLDVACLDCEREVLAIGCWDNSVRVLQLPRMEALSSQTSSVRPHSVAVLRDAAGAGGGTSILRLEIGLANGVLVRSVLDLGHGGAIVDTRSHVLGSKPVRLQPAVLGGGEGRVVLCSSSRMWVAAQSGTSPCPLSYRACEFAAQYDEAGGALVLVGPKNVLSLATVGGGRSGGGVALPRFNHDVFALDRTPRRLVKHPKMDAFVVIEGDADSFPSQPVSSTSSSSSSSFSAANKPKRAKGDDDDDGGGMDMDIDDDGEDNASASASAATAQLPTEDAVVDAELEAMRRVGYRKQAQPTWSSCIRVVQPFASSSSSEAAAHTHTLQRIQLPVDEMAVSLEHCRIQSEDYIFVGTVTSLRFHPTRAFASCHIRCYRVGSNNRLELVHVTPVDDVPTALCFFDGRLLCGSGGGLTLYELGKQRLLRKCEARHLLGGGGGTVSFIKPVSQDRIVVGDANESVVFVTYSKPENSFAVFADDVFPRMCTPCAGEMVDANTCALGDKFGNLAVLRLPQGATGQDAKSRAAQARNALWEAGGGGAASGGGGLAPHKLDVLAHYYVGELVTALQRVTLAPGRSEVLVYGTVGGAVGALMPFASRDDVDFFAQLELAMRRHYRPITNRDHLQYRSYYAPVKNVVDGDLCEQFATATDQATQQRIAKDMDRTVEEIKKRLEEQRWQVMW